MCVMDAAQIFAAPEMMELKLRQIAYSDMLILNKTDLVGRDEIARIRAWLDEHFHRYRLVEATRGNVPLEILLSSGRFDAAHLEPMARDHDEHHCQDPHCEQHRHRGDHAKAFSTWSYETDRLLSLGALRETVSRLPANIYRCKGVIRSADAPDRRVVLQVVGKRVDLALENDWGNRAPHTQIVAIGAFGTLDGEALREKFDGCFAEAGLTPQIAVQDL